MNFDYLIQDGPKFEIESTFREDREIHVMLYLVVILRTRRENIRQARPKQILDLVRSKIFRLQSSDVNKNSYENGLR
jgi:hypothetical protein